MNIFDLLAEKEFLGKSCLAYPHIGDKKITLTIKISQVGEKNETSNEAI